MADKPVTKENSVEETVDQIATAIRAAAAGELAGVYSPSVFLENLEELEGVWEDWLKRMFPQVASSSFAPHHKDFWEWAWAIEADSSPQPFAAGWPRGHGKSSSVEMAPVAWGALGRRNYILYVCETQDQADRHVQSIQALLEGSEIELFYPDLGTRSVNKYKSSKGWKRDRLVTSAGLIIEGIGLDTAARGIKFEHRRPDVIIFDDIDNEGDSPARVRKKINLITKKIIPAGARNVAILFAQNLIHEDSIASMIFDGRADFLGDIILSGPIPAVRGFKYDTWHDQEGRTRHTITGGVATWEGMDLAACQYWLNRVGLTPFMMEWQHDTKIAGEGLIYPEWNELYHVITYSEFIAVFGEIALDERGDFRIPLEGNCGCTQDWGTTIGHPCVTLWAWRPTQTLPCDDCVFFYRELVRPVWPHPKGNKVEPVTPHDIAELIKKAEEPWAEAERTIIRVMSHEASATQGTYTKHEGLNFMKWIPDRMGGIAQVQNATDIDITKPHPFRRDPLTGATVMGRPKLYYVVPDNQGALYYDKEGKLRVKSAVDSRGFIRTRWEKPRYRMEADAQGNEKPRPGPLNNDAMDAERGMGKYFFVGPRELTEEEAREKSLPQRLKQETIAKEIALMPAEMAAQRIHTRMLVLSQKIEEEQAEEEENHGGHFYFGGSFTRGEE